MRARSPHEGTSAPPSVAVRWLTRRLAAACARLPGEAGVRALVRHRRLNRRSRTEAACREFDALLAGLGPGSLCIDAGANIGEFAEAMAATGAEVHAFEPDPWCFEHLSARLADRPRVHLHRAAVGAEAGTAVLRRVNGFADDPYRYSQGSTLITDRAADLPARSRLSGAPADHFEVAVVDFLAFLRGLGRPVDLVKMDIEGAELAILERIAADPAAVPVAAMFVETHEALMPEHRLPVARLARRLARVGRPRISLDWI